MKKTISLFCVLLLCMGSYAEAAPLSNDDIGKLLSAGLGEATVLQAIDTATEFTFDTSVDALIKLKKAGASDAIIQKMMLRQTSQQTSTQASTSPQTNSGISGGKCVMEVLGYEDRATMLVDGKVIPMQSHIATINSDVSGGSVIASALTLGIVSAKGSASLRLRGEHATLRIQNRLPEFPDIMMPAGSTPDDSIPLVQMKVKEKSRVWIIGTTEMGIGGLKDRSSYDDSRIPLSMEIIADNCTWRDKTWTQYRLKPAKPLDNGEYGLVMGTTVFDFAVSD